MVSQLLPHLSREERSEKWHVVTPQAEDLTEGRAIVAVLGALAPTRWLSRFLLWIRADRALNGVYQVLGRHRGKLGRLVPDVEGPRRYP